MSENWPKDMKDMASKYKIQDAVNKLNRTELRSFLHFRVRFIEEELNELKEATKPRIPIDREEIVDALIDICVVAIGTLDLFDIDAHKAWDEVLKANMNKEVGVKETRPNPMGLPDLIKPKDWKAPDHTGNHGKLNGI
jgi:DNA-binding transcriptional regulator/RsmH inhibitor MraZ